MYKYNKMQRKNDRKKRRRSLSDFLFSAVRHDRSNQLSVLCVSKQKVLVGANVGDSSIVEEQVEICFKDIGIVSDYDRCAVSQGPAQIVRNLVHRLGVKARARLVNDYQAMRSTEKLRQTEPATLTKNREQLADRR